MIKIKNRLMKNDLYIKNGVVIPAYELEITASKSGGPGGQHANKTSTRISVRWNIKNSNALSQEQKELLVKKLENQLTSDGDLIIHSGISRSQHQNKEMALARLAYEIQQALYIPKKRVETKLPKSIKETRLQEKKRKSSLKKTRQKKFED